MVNSKINAFLDCNHCSLGALPSPIKPKKSHKKISHQNQKTAEISVVFFMFKASHFALSKTLFSTQFQQKNRRAYGGFLTVCLRF
jgi:hypothetical protein